MMIALNKLNFSYPKAGPLFDRLDLELKAGTICGMLGPNGAGKSTLLKILAGLLCPASGTCRVHDFTPSERQPAFLADLFLLPEEIFVPALTADVYERRYSLFYPRYDANIFSALMTEFALPRNKTLNTLSHGQKKKFLLAFGIATNTRLLILDEPSNGLDIPSKTQFRKVLLSHFSEDRSFIISTHQVHDLEGLIDSVMIISDGSILLHEDLDTIGARITVGREKAPAGDALYYEESLEGFAVVRVNDTNIESRVDLGLLFGFVTSDTTKARQLISGDAANE
jgi:ABC-2 type transport system ATP-binding protein